MNGTSFSVTLPMRLTPPSSTMATIIATTTPTTRLTVGRMLFRLLPYASRAESMAVTMVLTWVALPVPKTVSTPNSEYSTARNCHRLPRPFLI